MPGQVRIGISGWRYGPWRGVFYPKGLRQADELAFAARHFDSIEINFFASGPLCLEEKLGPFLWQFPPQLAFDGRFEEFFAALPRDTHAAAELAARHDRRVRHPAFGSSTLRPLRHAVEVRHESFRTPGFVELLRRQGLAVVVADTAGRWPYFEDATSDFVYVRLHGDEKLYVSGYSPAALAHWARKVAAFRSGVPGDDPVGERDVFVYFDNDVKVHAPFDAASLMKKLGQPRGPGLRRAAPGKATIEEARSTWPAARRSRVAR